MITDEEIADEAVAERVRQLGRDLVAYADVSRYPETVSRGRRQKRSPRPMTEHSVSTADQSGAGAMRAIRIHEHGGSTC